MPLIGTMRKRVVLQKRNPSVDSEGTPQDGWVTVGKIWAQVTPTAGTEALEAGQVEARVNHQVTTRYRPDLALASATASAVEGHSMRLRLGARILDIQTVVDPDERHQELQLGCVERQR